MKQSAPTLSFNRGIISRLGLARIDVPRMRLAAAIQKNFMPRVLGSMMLRPGTEYIAATRNNAVARTISYVRSATVQARIELTDSVMRVLIDDAVVTRPAVTAAVTNGSFTASLASWTDASEVGGSTSWNPEGYAQLLGDGTNFAILRQQVTVNETGVEHALNIAVARGPVILRVGSTLGGEEYVGETTLASGTHSLAFTPSGNFFIQVSSARAYPVYVNAINVEGAGAMELPTPWTEADLPNLRWTISADVVYVCDGANQQRKIERRGTHSWSVVLYEPETGPFRIQNVTNTTLAPNSLSGEVTITASKSTFRPTHVGALFRIASQGQSVSKGISAQNTFSDPIKVIGAGEARRFSVIVDGTFTATVTLQYSVGAVGSWVDAKSWVSVPVSESYLDAQDDQTIYYRIGVKTGNYTSGTLLATLNYAAGSITGIGRIVAYTSATQVTADVLKSFGATTASADWWEGEWSNYRGWPSAIALHDGREWHAGLSKIWGSISDAYEDFDDTFLGDAGPISRSIGEGPVDSIHWLMSLGRLMIGTAINSSAISAAKIDGDNIMAARSNSFDEPLTPTNFSLKNASVKGVFVDRSQQRLFQLAYSIESNDYTPEDLSVLVPDLNSVGIAGICVQMKPDVRIHCWRTDGTVGCLVFDKAENVVCWVEVETFAGFVIDVSVLPGPVEDQVYYVVERTVDASTVRYHEKWALESECSGQPEARLADCHLMIEGAEATSIGGLDHLEGMQVVVWGWNTVNQFFDDEGHEVGRDLGTFTVSGGQITGLAYAITNACVGIPYEGTFLSAKQAFIEALGSPLNQMKRIAQLGLVLVDTHYQGIQYGPSLEELYDLSKAENIKVTNSVKVWDEKETRLFPMGGHWDTDSRVALRAASPRPANVLAMTVGMEANSKAA